VTQQIEVIQNGASKIINALQSAIVTTMTAAAEGVEGQVRVAQAFQRLEAQEVVLDWLVQRRIDQEQKLEQSGIREAQKALIRRKIEAIDDELTALLSSSGIEEKAAKAAVLTVHTPPPRLVSGRRK